MRYAQDDLFLKMNHITTPETLDQYLTNKNYRKIIMNNKKLKKLIFFNFKQKFQNLMGHHKII